LASGGEACAGPCDVADYAGVAAMVDETVRRFGKPEILVNNAGMIEPIGALVEADPALWARNIDVNLIGAYHAVRATAPQMLENGSGTVINISSGAATPSAAASWSAGTSNSSASALAWFGAITTRPPCHRHVSP